MSGWASKRTVAVTRCADYSREAVARALARQFELLGGMERFVSRGDSVLIKPNLIAPRSHRHATQTHTSVIVETARLVKDFGGKPLVADSPAWANVAACAKALRLTEPLAELGVPLQQLAEPRTCSIGPNGIKMGISSTALDADVIINLPKFKAHQQLVTTFAVKNMFGCVTGKHKAVWHFRKGGECEEFCGMLLDLFEYIGPAVSVIDGVMAMDGRGPINGRTRPLGWIIGGVDPIACELTCCDLLGLDPQDVPIIRTTMSRNGSCNHDDVVLAGDDFEPGEVDDFVIPPLVPIRFSLYHVCRSWCRQGWKLAKAALGRAEAD